MKKFLPYIIGLVILAGGLAFFVYKYSPTTLDANESVFTVKNLNDITKIRLSTETNTIVSLTLKGKKWMVNDKYEANEEAMGMLLEALKKMETQYQVPAPAEPIVIKDLIRQHNRCEIFLNGETEPSKIYDVGGPTADGVGTYMMMIVNGKMARHPYVTHIPSINAYMTQRYYPDIEHWRSIWIYRENDHTIESLKLVYNRDIEKSFEIKRVTGDSFVIANSKGEIGPQPKQRHIHQYLEFYNQLPVLFWKNKDTAAQDTVLSNIPYCTLNIKRTDKTESKAVIYYMPIADWSRVQVDENTGRKLMYDIENLYISLEDKKDFAIIQYHTWGNIFHSYDEFFRKPEPLPKQ